MFDNNTAYVGYSGGGGGVTIKTYNGSGWMTIGGLLGTGATSFDGNYSYCVSGGIIDFTYPALATGATSYTYVAVNSFVGGAWTSIGGFYSDTTYPWSYYDSYLCSDGGGNTYMLINLGSSFALKKYNGSTWSDLSSASGSNASSIYYYNGNVYVACLDSTYGWPAVYVYNGTSLSKVGSTPFTSDTPRTLLVSGYNGNLYLAYGAKNGVDTLQANVWTYNGSNWLSVGNANFSSSSALGLSMSVYNGTPYVAYWCNGSLRVQYYDGGSWANVGGASGVVGNSGGYQTSIVVNNGTPYVAVNNGEFWVYK